MRKLAALAAFASLAAFGPLHASAEPVVLINIYEVPAGKEDAATTAWSHARDFFQTQPGYISTKLHRSIRPDGRFALINVAQWRSPEDFHVASAAMRAKLGNPMPEGVTFTAGLYRVVAN